MGLLDGPQKAISGVGNFLQNPFSTSVNADSIPKPDYPDGLVIQEITENPNDAQEIRLVGNMMPKNTFDREVTLRLQKDQYPGSDDPVVHVLGYEENDITIRGRLYDKRYRDERFRGVATEIREAMEEMEKRKNLVRISLGEWRRYAFISKVKTSEKTLADIDYEMTFLILGSKAPKNFHIIDRLQDIPIEVNNALIAEAAEFQENYSTVPQDVPRSIADLITSLTSSVASVLATVTGFVDDVVSSGEDISNSLSRAIGLTRYARSQLVIFRRRIGGISYQLSFNHMKIPTKYRTAAFIGGSITSTLTMQELLNQLLKRFQALQQTVPLARHKVIVGDTLQKLSLRFYGSADHWKKIYDHNRLTSTDLSRGAVLEIPRL